MFDQNCSLQRLYRLGSKKNPETGDHEHEGHLRPWPQLQSELWRSQHRLKEFDRFPLPCVWMQRKCILLWSKLVDFAKYWNIQLIQLGEKSEKIYKGFSIAEEKILIVDYRKIQIFFITCSAKLQLPVRKIVKMQAHKIQIHHWNLTMSFSRVSGIFLSNTTSGSRSPLDALLWSIWISLAIVQSQQFVERKGSAGTGTNLASQYFNLFFSLFQVSSFI